MEFLKPYSCSIVILLFSWRHLVHIQVSKHATSGGWCQAEDDLIHCCFGVVLHNQRDSFPKWSHQSFRNNEIPSAVTWQNFWELKWSITIVQDIRRLEMIQEAKFLSWKTFKNILKGFGKPALKSRVHMGNRSGFPPVLCLFIWALSGRCLLFPSVAASHMF